MSTQTNATVKAMLRVCPRDAIAGSGDMASVPKGLRAVKPLNRRCTAGEQARPGLTVMPARYEVDGESYTSPMISGSTMI